ncbi:hypothetical protein H4V95_000331 [Arthrobacter sp. CAN_C5]|nr:hypothetical protein [Arthrobacter sp. CAN_C5]
MATGGQFYWPSVGNSVAAYGQFFMAADTARKAGTAAKRKQTTRHLRKNAVALWALATARSGNVWGLGRSWARLTTKRRFRWLR